MLTRCLAGGGAVVAGAAGVGKTRLARAAEAVAADAGRTVERLAATRSGSALPLAPFARFRRPVPIDARDDPLVALRQAVVADHQPGDLLLSVDDGHLLDDASAAVVHELCASGAASVLVTLRTRVPAPAAITALWKDDLCELVELQPLARHEVGQLLAAALSAPVDNATTHALWERSRGNVMFLRELVRSGAARAVLHEAGGLWTWSGELRAPPRLAELLAERLSRLDPPGRQMLELLALGEPLDWDVLTGLAPAATAESLVADGLVEVSGLLARLAHPLLGDVVLDELPEPRRRRLLHDLAAAGDPESEPVRVALWQLDAGTPADPRLLVRAARDCVFVDARIGERCARAALASDDSGDDSGDDSDVRVEAAVLLTQHLMLSHQAAAADEALATLDAADLPEPDRAQLTVSRANVLTWGLGRPDDAVALLDAAAAGAEPEIQRLLASHSGPMLMFAGRATEAVDRAERLAGDPASSPTERLRAALGEVPMLVALGRPEAALRRAGEVLPLVPGCLADLPVAIAQLGAGITLAQMLSGDLDTAEGLIRPAYDEGVARDIPLLRGGAALRLGQLALWRGRVVTAAGLLREAVLALQQADAGLLAWALDSLRMAAALRGDSDGVAAAEGAGATAVRFPLFQTEAHRADAAVAAATGETSRAREHVAAGLTTARASGHLIQATLLLFDQARYGDPLAAAAGLDQVAGVEGTLAALFRQAVGGMAESDGPGLDTTARALAELGYLLAAAETARAAARAHGVRGRRADERRADAIADALADRCEGATTPLLADRPEATRLTSREREVAQLAAQGLPDAAIASRLGLSVRTVETHLHRAYFKLGLTGRTELGDVLLRTGPRPPA